MIIFSELFIATAHAQGAATDAAPAAGGGFGSLIPLILIFFIFYIFLLRPQQKKLKEHQKMVSALKRGDKVVTAGGILGTVAKINDDDTLDVTIANNVDVKVQKNTITDLAVKKDSSAKEEKQNKKEN